MKPGHLFLLVLSVYSVSAAPLSSQGIDFTYTTSYRIYNSNRAETREEYAGIWIPDMERDIRGLVMTTMVRNEFEFNNDSSIRNVCAEQDLALLFFYGEAQGDYYLGGIMGFHPQDGHDTVLLRVLRDFALRSGKPEIEHAPWLTFGHSAGITFCRNLAWWNPERTFGVVHYKTGGISAPGWADPDATIIGIPWLAVSARIDKFEPTPEQGWNDSRAEVLAWRAMGHTISHIVEPTMEEGHSIWRPFTGAYIAEFIRHAASGRIPEGEIAREGPVELILQKESWGTLTTSESEVLMDQAELPEELVWLYQDADPFYVPDRFWHINTEMAIHWINYEHRDYAPFEPGGDTILNGVVKSWNEGIPLGKDALEEIRFARAVDYDADSAASGWETAIDASGGFRLRSTFPLAGLEVKFQNDSQYPGKQPVQSYLNGADALLVHRIASEDPSFRPDVFLISAADVNLDGVVDSSDVRMVMDRSVLKQSSFSADFVFMDSIWNKFNKKTRISGGYPDDDGEGFSSHRLPGLGPLVSVGYTPGNPYPVYKKTTIYGIALGDLDGSLDMRDRPPSETDSILMGKAQYNAGGDTVRIPVSLSGQLQATSLDLNFVISEILPLKGAVSWFELAGVESDPGTYVAFHSADSLAMVSLFHPGGIPVGEPVIRLLFTPVEGGGSDPYLVDLAGWVNGTPVTVYGQVLSHASGDPGTGEEIRLFPNPATSRFLVELRHSCRGEVVMEILDPGGRVVSVRKEQKQLQDMQVTIDVSSLEPGAYFLRISVEGLRRTIPFVKQ